MPLVADTVFHDEALSTVLRDIDGPGRQPCADDVPPPSPSPPPPTGDAAHQSALADRDAKVARLEHASIRMRTSPRESGHMLNGECAESARAGGSEEFLGADCVVPIAVCALGAIRSASRHSCTMPVAFWRGLEKR